MTKDIGVLEATLTALSVGSSLSLPLQAALVSGAIHREMKQRVSHDLDRHLLVQQLDRFLAMLPLANSMVSKAGEMANESERMTAELRALNGSMRSGDPPAQSKLLARDRLRTQALFKLRNLARTIHAEQQTFM